MQIDVTHELGRLLVFIADVATAIRTNSLYAGDYESRDPHEVGLDVMWLSDSLHCFDRLGQALQSGDGKAIEAASEGLFGYYGMFIDGADGKGLKGDPKGTFERYGHLCNANEARAALEAIRLKAVAAQWTGA